MARGTGPRAPIVIVAIDDETLQALGMGWPLPRAMTGQVAERLAAAGAAAIGLDLILSEPSVHGPADDQALGESVARAGRVVLACAMTVTRTVIGWKQDLNVPVPIIRRGAAAIGALNVHIGSDGIIRRVQLSMSSGAEKIPALGVALLRVAASHGVPIRPLPDGPDLQIDFVGGPGTFPRLPYHRVLRGRFPPESVRGRIVLVGATTPSLHDVHRTPVAPKGDMPGVEIQANIVATLLSGRDAWEAPTWAVNGVAVLAAVGAALLTAGAGLRGLALVGLAAVGIGVASFLAFSLGALWLRPAAPALGLAIGAVAAIVGSRSARSA